MATPDGSEKKEHPSTYFVQDRKSEKELTRLTLQDQLLTAGMGGVLPEQFDSGTFRRVLDVACGTGGWILQAAEMYPEMSLIGIDISLRMVEYAREQASAQHLSERVEFHTMDALRMLEFPANFFDLVNLRLGSSFLRTWDWAKLLSEMLRVTHSGGIVRVTETDVVSSNSPALTQLWEMFLCALYQAGHLFEQDSKGLSDHLVTVLTQHGCKQVQTQTYILYHQAGTPAGQAYYENTKYGFQTTRPFMQKWGCIKGDYDAIYQQALYEIQQPDFRATQRLVSFWGYKTRPSTK